MKIIKNDNDDSMLIQGNSADGDSGVSTMARAAHEIMLYEADKIKWILDAARTVRNGDPDKMFMDGFAMGMTLAFQYVQVEAIKIGTIKKEHENGD